MAREFHPGLENDLVRSEFLPEGNGWKPFINLTLTRFVTSRSLVCSGILFSGGNEIPARFNPVFSTTLLTV
jgi:hypothetical protein